jgi:hypothetical protein
MSLATTVVSLFYRANDQRQRTLRVGRSRRQRLGLHLEPLEPRLLLSVDLVRRRPRIVTLDFATLPRCPSPSWVLAW